MTLVMYDAINPKEMPGNGAIYAGYVAGFWPTFPSLPALFPGRSYVSVSPFASDDADFLDIENGDAVLADFPAWFHRQQSLHPAGYRPGAYTSQANLAELAVVLADAHIARVEMRLWSAHYGVPHICSPAACRAGLSADATQWFSGTNYDESMCASDFLSTPAVLAPLKPKENPDMISVLTDSTGKHFIVSAEGKRELSAQEFDGYLHLTEGVVSYSAFKNPAVDLIRDIPGPVDEKITGTITGETQVV